MNDFPQNICPLCFQRKDDVLDIICDACNERMQADLAMLDQGIVLCNSCDGKGRGHLNFNLKRPFIPGNESYAVQCRACKGGGFQVAE